MQFSKLLYISVLGITGYKDKWRKWYHSFVNALYFRFAGSLFFVANVINTDD